MILDFKVQQICFLVSPPLKNKENGANEIMGEPMILNMSDVLQSWLNISLLVSSSPSSYYIRLHHITIQIHNDLAGRVKVPKVTFKEGLVDSSSPKGYKSPSHQNPVVSSLKGRQSLRNSLMEVSIYESHETQYTNTLQKWGIHAIHAYGVQNKNLHVLWVETTLEII